VIVRSESVRCIARSNRKVKDESGGRGKGKQRKNRDQYRCSYKERNWHRLTENAKQRTKATQSRGKRESPSVNSVSELSEKALSMRKPCDFITERLVQRMWSEECGPMRSTAQLRSSQSFSVFPINFQSQKSSIPTCRDNCAAPLFGSYRCEICRRVPIIRHRGTNPLARPSQDGGR